MGRRKSKSLLKLAYKPLKRYKKAGWYWNGFRCGTFCPVCGEPAYIKRGVHPRYICFNCGWEELQPKIRVVPKGNGKYDLINELIPK